MTTFTEGNHDAEFIVSEANFHRSRDSGEVASGQNLAAGTVVQPDGGSRWIAYVGDEFTNRGQHQSADLSRRERSSDDRQP
jgi:hypothetical protein